MKECSKCHIKKSLSQFYFRKSGYKSGQYYNHCKKCLKERGRKYYKDNRIRQLTLANTRRRIYRKNRRDFINKQKNKPCVDCGKKVKVENTRCHPCASKNYWRMQKLDPGIKITKEHTEYQLK